MTPVELEELIRESPYLYHMAMKGSWPLIREYGLLPTDALLALFEVDEALTQHLTRERRAESVTIQNPLLGEVMIRDQIPMHHSDLLRCLQDDLTPIDWYKLLNERVFFWLSEERLERLLCAGAYRAMEHLVLKIPTEPIIMKYREQIELSPMNSGCTKPFPHPRGKDTFLSIDNYPYSFWKDVRKRRPGERVVELTVIGGVPDISDHVVDVSIQSCKGSKSMVET